VKCGTHPGAVGLARAAIAWGRYRLLARRLPVWRPLRSTANTA